MQLRYPPNDTHNQKKIRFHILLQRTSTRLFFKQLLPEIFVKYSKFFCKEILHVFPIPLETWTCVPGGAYLRDKICGANGWIPTQLRVTLLQCPGHGCLRNSISGVWLWENERMVWSMAWTPRQHLHRSKCNHFEYFRLSKSIKVN